MADLSRARKSFDDALVALPSIARGELDEAFIYRGLASVEDKRNSVQLPFNNCNAAERIFLELLRRKRDITNANAGAQGGSGAARPNHDAAPSGDPDQRRGTGKS